MSIIPVLKRAQPHECPVWQAPLSERSKRHSFPQEDAYCRLYVLVSRVWASSQSPHALWLGTFVKHTNRTGVHVNSCRFMCDRTGPEVASSISQASQSPCGDFVPMRPKKVRLSVGKSQKMNCMSYQ